MASANLGLIRTLENEIRIYYIFRSMNIEELELINQKISSLQNNFIVKEYDSDPIWEVNYDSVMLKKYKKLYFKEYSTYPKEEIYHGSIECSSIKKRIEGLDIISIGGLIKNFHTIDEVTYISSWLKIYNLLIKFIEIL